MDHPGSFRLAFAGERSAAAEQRVDEGPAPVSGSGVHDHAGRFVYHQQRIVFVDDGDWNVFTGDDALFASGDLDPHKLARFGTVASLFPTTADEDVALSDQRRGLCPRKLGTLGNKEIEADIAVRLDGKLSDITQD